jgi:hypothetical protein
VRPVSTAGGILIRKYFLAPSQAKRSDWLHSPGKSPDGTPGNDRNTKVEACFQSSTHSIMQGYY